MSNRSSSVRTAVAPKSETTANVNTTTEKFQKNDSNVDPDIARLKIPQTAIKELQALVDAPRQPVLDRGNTAPRDRLFASLLVMTTVAFVAVPLSLMNEPGEKSSVTAYVCAECHAENPLKPKDAVRCRECGHRVLYKKRCRNLMVFDAR
ncbi:hypothetical protein QR680_019137 [Steinernema hermaphroditum]|uniref:DNA-directed RNA polymerases I, II, and III subunit RPABC4 n=1 Tax=Steinernema hermaphroditum TaxID=289476 RepID=A0AA39LRT2_9BILA|nr:hypothetical protein QR680_019137 [Steinernema hermaphroditum]